MNAITEAPADTAIPARSLYRVVIAAGGTGGHFFPAEALAAALLARGHEIALLTDGRSGAAGSAVFAPHPIHVLRGAGIAGRGGPRAAAAAFALAVGTIQARSVLHRLQPAAIVGFGGYPTIAPATAGRLSRRRVPIVLHEQNAVLGRANRALARRAAAVALSFAQTKAVPDGVMTVLTGNPVRPAIAARASQLYQPPGEGPVRLLVIGGSQGARVLSEILPAALSALPAALRARLRLTQQCRASDLEAVRSAYADAGIEAELSSFFTDMAGLIAGAHLVIARAGASTVAELAVIGRPAILVPLPSAIDDHQAANAAALGAAAITLRQDIFTAPALTALLAGLVNDQARLVALATAISRLGHARAAEALADLVEHSICAAAA